MTLEEPGVLPDKPPVALLRPGDRLVCLYRPGGAAPGRAWNEGRFRGPFSDCRFDHQHPPFGEDPDRSVWYAARSLRGAVAETYGKRGILDRLRDPQDGVALVRVVARLHLVDLLGIAAARFHLTQEIGTTEDYAACQAWARALYERYEDLVGIRWRGHVAGSICVVLTDRAPRSSVKAEADQAVTDPVVWPRVARAARACGVRIV